MKLFIISLCLIPFSVSATDYINNDGTRAPETMDRAVHEGDIQKEEENLTTEFDAKEVKEKLVPSGDAQSIQKEEEQQIDDNYLIGPYDKNGKMTYPSKDEQEKKDKLRIKQLD